MRGVELCLAVVLAPFVFGAAPASANFTMPVNGPVEMFGDNLKNLQNLLRANGGDDRLKKGLAVIVICPYPGSASGCVVEVDPHLDSPDRRIAVTGDSASLLRDKMFQALKSPGKQPSKVMTLPGWAMCHDVGSSHMWCEVSLDKPKGKPRR